MRAKFLFPLAPLAILAIAGSAVAEDLKSGLPVGKTMLSMPIEKIGGADDGVNPGQTICYT